MVSKLIYSLAAIGLAALCIGAWPSSGRYPTPSTYVGPGDIVPGAVAWYGFRSYNNANATAGAKAVKIRNGSNSLKDITVLNNGNLDVATALAFAGVHVTCSSATAANSTTLTVSGCTGAPFDTDILIASGGTGTFTDGARIINHSSGCSIVAGSGTCTMNVAQTVTGVTLTAYNPITVATFYDQTGNGQNLTQATNASQPELIPRCINHQPCMYFNGSYKLSNASCVGNGIPNFISAIAEQTAVNGSNSGVIYNPCNGQNGANGIDFYFFTPFALLNNKTSDLSQSLFGGAALNTAHLLQAVSASFGNSTLTIDNTVNTGNAGTKWFVAASPQGASMGDGPNGSINLTGYISQAGIWQTPMQGTRQTNLCANDNAYWLAGGLSCTTTPFPAFQNITGPCDLATCAEAWSVTRAMKNSYKGPLFQLYNPSTPAVLDIQQTASRQADMTTWSAFCGGVASNCKISRIYAQINNSENDATVVNFNSLTTSFFGGGCKDTNPPTACMADFSIEAATGLPVLITKADSTHAQQYSANLQWEDSNTPNNGGIDQPLTNVASTRTSTTTIVMNGSWVTATPVCCGQFGMAHKFSGTDIAGSDYMTATQYGLYTDPSGFIPTPYGCNTSTQYCIGIDLECGPPSCPGPPPLGTPTQVFFSTTNFNLFYIVEWDASQPGSPPAGLASYYNGHTGIGPVQPNSGQMIADNYFHFAGGGDLTPSPTYWREGFFTNNVLTPTQKTNVFNNNTAFYSGLSFP